MHKIFTRYVLSIVAACAPFSAYAASTHNHGGMVVAMADEHSRHNGTSPNQSAEANADFAKNLGLIRGHLLIGDQLIKAGLWKEAQPHFLHPTNELYEPISPVLTLYKLPPFDGRLISLSEAVKTKNAATYKNLLEDVSQQLATAEQVAESHATDVNKFRIALALNVLKESILEYSEAVQNSKDGVFHEAVEYQDARGFILYGDQMIERQSDYIISVDDKILPKLRKELTYLKKAFPGIMPPARAISSPQDISDSIAKIEAAVQKLL